MCAEHGQLRASCKAAPLEGELVAATFYGFRVWGLGYGSKGVISEFYWDNGRKWKLLFRV